MPTSIPVALFSDLDNHSEFFGTRAAAAILATWAASMLLIGAIAHFGSETSALNSFEFLAIF